MCGTGYTILKVVKILSEGPESLIDVVMNQGVCSVLVQCVSLFLELPPPCGKDRVVGVDMNFHLSVVLVGVTKYELSPSA